jgi:spermidine/putrescine transport system ATP-binding protein
MWDVELRQVTKKFGDIVAVDEITMEIGNGEFFAVLGPSGSGKTTTLRMIAGLVTPTGGEIYIRGQKVNYVPVHKRDLAMVFQNYALFPHLSVYENVAFGLKMHKATPSAISEKVEQALRLVRLEDMEARFPSQLSGGQQQRVALARCLAIEPAVLLLDEPLGALDKKLREEMQVELRVLQRKLGITTIFVTHDQEEALSLSDRIAILNEGRIEQIGTPVEIYENPRNWFVSQFIGICNFLDARVAALQAPYVVAVTHQGMRIHAPFTDQQWQLTEEVTVAIRPERIQLHTSCPQGSLTAYEAEIRHIVYLGSEVHYYVTCEEGEELQIHEPNIRLESVRPELGQRVWLTFETEAVQLMKA